MPSAVVLPFPIVGLYSWASSVSGQVERAGTESWVELGDAADSTKVRLKISCHQDISIPASLSPGQVGRPSTAVGGAGDAAPLLLGMDRCGTVLMLE